jgi:hypothetical protein
MSRLRCSEPSCNRVILPQGRTYLYVRRQFCGSDCIDTFKAREARINCPGTSGDNPNTLFAWADTRSKLY